MTQDKICLALSNIAWDKADDTAVYAAMQEYGFTGLELAPTRIFPQQPYENLSAAALFGGWLHQKYGFCVPSIQSIWYGRTENLFDPAGAEALRDYTVQAFDFAHALHCPSLVFGCPKNRALPAGTLPQAADLLFAELGRLAAQRGVRLAIEANPPVYTNFITRTADAFALVRRIGSPGLAVNFDLSTVLTNGERLRDFIPDLALISHVHISEPELAPIQKRPIHQELAMMLKAVGYHGFVSVEMRKTDVETIRRTLSYLAEVFA
jgi:sugar phosphate isomerase/epimerase